MFQALPKTITFEDFLEWKPDAGCYELHDGVIVEMPPQGDHEEINGFLAKKLNVQFDRLNLPYIIPKQALVKAPESLSTISICIARARMLAHNWIVSTRYPFVIRK
jgi:Uma2 family endonuclease